MRSRSLLGASCAVALAFLPTTSRAAALDVAGRLPDLALNMERADTGAETTAGSFAGAPVLLYFGYARCPDACPATLSNLVTVLRRIGPEAAPVRILFITVDPGHDDNAALREFAGAFGPSVIPLRPPSADTLAATARRYRAAYSTAGDGQNERVTHSAAVYLFDRHGQARFLLTGLDKGQPADLDAAATAIRQVLNEHHR